MPVRRPVHPSPVVVPRSSYYKSGPRHDYGIDDSISQVEYFSNAVLDDTYDSARKSKNRDNELIRNTRAAIRTPAHSSDTRTGRSTKRFRSLPPSASRSQSPDGALVRRGNPRASLALNPPPTSLLSTKINSYLRGSSTPRQLGAPSDIKSSISYKSFLVDPPSPLSYRDPRSIVSYRSYLTDPSVSSPFSTRSSSKVLKGSSPRSFQSRRALSYGHDQDNDYEDEDDVDDYHVGSYRRKYKILKSPSAVDQYASDEEDEESVAGSGGGTYSCPRPSGVPNLKLSSYTAPYDGSYEADMAEMYDYVPFGPSRHGILELCPEPSVTPLPSITSSPLQLTDPDPPSVTITPTYNHLDESLTKTSFANNLVFDSILSSTASRAKEALAQTSLPQYKNASLVLSVEGSAVSEDGKNRYGFRYYPPPIPIKGSGLGLDERILGISPKPVSSADSFLSKYLDRLRDIRSDIRDHVDTGDRPWRGRSLAPSSSSSSVVSRSPPASPYSHRTLAMPVTYAGRAHSVPVSSYRTRLADGQSHRVDVYPLVVSETSLPSDRKLHLYSAGSGKDYNKLTVLEKINIKAAIIGCKLESEEGARKPPKRPRSQFAANKLREFKIQDIERRYK